MSTIRLFHDPGVGIGHAYRSFLLFHVRFHLHQPPKGMLRAPRLHLYGVRGNSLQVHIDEVMQNGTIARQSSGDP